MGHSGKQSQNQLNHIPAKAVQKQLPAPEQRESYPHAEPVLELLRLSARETSRCGHVLRNCDGRTQKQFHLFGSHQKHELFKENTDTAAFHNLYI